MFAHGQRQLGGQAATIHRQGEEAVEASGITAAARAEKDLFAVVGPTHGGIHAGMIGEAARRSTGGRDDIDVQVAVVFPGESDPGAVGREDGVRFEADAGGQALSVTASAGNQPKVTCVGEGNLRAAQRGFLQELRPLRLRTERSGNQQNENNPKSVFLHE